MHTRAKHFQKVSQKINRKLIEKDTDRLENQIKERVNVGLGGGAVAVYSIKGGGGRSFYSI